MCRAAQPATARREWGGGRVSARTASRSFFLRRPARVQQQQQQQARQAADPVLLIIIISISAIAAPGARSGLPALAAARRACSAAQRHTYTIYILLGKLQCCSYRAIGVLDAPCTLWPGPGICRGPTLARHTLAQLARLFRDCPAWKHNSLCVLSGFLTK